MKNVLAILFLLFSSLCVYSQEVNSEQVEINYEAIKFMGIPMEGPFSTFKNRLEEKGLKYVTTNSVGDHVFQGKFAGYNAIELVQITPKNTVYKCGVIIGEGTDGFSTWNNLISAYNDIKNLLTQKYGDSIPEYTTEEFEHGDVKESERLYELKMGRCKYCVCFNIRGRITSAHMDLSNMPIGSVEVSLTQSGCVQVLYVGLKNLDEMERLKIDDV